MIQKSLLLTLTLLSFSLAAQADPPRHPWQLDESYNGSHREAFEKLRFQIQNLVATGQLELASRMGLDYREGFRYPLTVGFVDEGPSRSEYALAYVKLWVDESGIHQRLNINLDAYERFPFNFEKVFYHEMSHVVLSDAVGADAFTKFPVWFIEGTALWVAGQGEQLTRAEAHRYPGYAEHVLVADLEGPRQALLYPQYFLAVEYIVQTKGVAALQNMTRDLVNGKPYEESLVYNLGENWSTFQKNVRDFSARTIYNLGTGNPFEKERPY